MIWRGDDAVYRNYECEDEAEIVFNFLLTMKRLTNSRDWFVDSVSLPIFNSYDFIEKRTNATTMLVVYRQQAPTTPTGI